MWRSPAQQSAVPRFELVEAAVVTAEWGLRAPFWMRRSIEYPLMHTRLPTLERMIGIPLVVSNKFD